MLHCTDSHDCAMCILIWSPKCIVSWKNAGETGDDDEVVPPLAQRRAWEAGAEEEEELARGESCCPSLDKLEEGQKNRLLIPSPVVWALSLLLTVVYVSISWHVLFHKEIFLQQNAPFLVQETNLDIYLGWSSNSTIQSFSFCFMFPMQQIHALSREKKKVRKKCRNTNLQTGSNASLPTKNAKSQPFS